MAKPLAFVLMPFSTDFDQIYNLFIVGALDYAGYDVRRADDLDNQQNILKDVIDGIASADLVVADLTGNNPNVSYEVGIAHALRRRVVLLTQDIESLPFDLRPYRTLPYTTHFADITAARERLVAVARGAREGTVSFSNPVLDFGGAAASVPAVVAATPDSETGRGFLDYVADVEESVAGLTSSTQKITDETNSIAQASVEAGERLSASHRSAVEKRTLLRAFAQRLFQFADEIERATIDYRKHLSKFEDAVEPVVTGVVPVSSVEDRKQLQEFLDHLLSISTAASTTRESQLNFAKIVKSLPDAERAFMQARARAARNIENVADLISKTIAILERSEVLGRRYLESLEM